MHAPGRMRGAAMQAHELLEAPRGSAGACFSLELRPQLRTGEGMVGWGCETPCFSSSRSPTTARIYIYKQGGSWLWGRSSNEVLKAALWRRPWKRAGRCGGSEAVVVCG